MSLGRKYPQASEGFPPVLRAQPLVARRRQKLRRSVIVCITFTVENA